MTVASIIHFQRPTSDMESPLLSQPQVESVREGPVLLAAIPVLEAGSNPGHVPGRKAVQGAGIKRGENKHCPIGDRSGLSNCAGHSPWSDQFFKQFPRPARVQIKLLPPLHPKKSETPLALTDRLKFTLAEALPMKVRGVFAEVPVGFAEK